MQFEWKSEYTTLALEFLDLHFGESRSLSTVYPCMRSEYPWGDHRPDVIDSRIPAKNNTEYHGLERHASQYHATAQYEFSYHHWLMAALWRRTDAEVNSFSDAGHSNAVRYCVKQAMYNKALADWQGNPSSSSPAPETFGLSAHDIDRKEALAEQQLEAVHAKMRES